MKEKFLRGFNRLTAATFGTTSTRRAPLGDCFNDDAAEAKGLRFCPDACGVPVRLDDEAGNDPRCLPGTK
jgi:hypothetical protein